jgi:hypothetical protein
MSIFWPAKRIELCTPALYLQNTTILKYFGKKNFYTQDLGVLNECFFDLTFTQKNT